jgi:flagellar hook assembly protein FlgD
MQAAIHYVLANDQKVIIQILDFSGRVVEELSFGLQLAGEHTAQWNPMFLEQGVYYLRIKYSRGAYKKVVIAR